MNAVPARDLTRGTQLATPNGLCVYQLTGNTDERGWHAAFVAELAQSAREKGWQTGEVAHICPLDIGIEPHTMKVIEDPDA